MICQGLYQHGVIDDNTLIDNICVMGFSWWRFKVPNHISMSNIPFTETPGLNNLEPNPIIFNREKHEPELKQAHLYRFDCQLTHKGHGINNVGHRVLEDAQIVSFSDNLDDSDPIAIVADRISNYDEIIIAPDADHTGWSSTYRWLYKLNETLVEKLNSCPLDLLSKNIRSMWLCHGLDADSIIKSYDEASSLTDPRVQRARNQGEAKRILDYWWFYNSAAVFSKLQRHVGVESPRIMSKYELMFLHLVKNWGKPVTLGSAINGMDCWVGSGKYTASHLSHDISINSFAAQCYKPKAGEARINMDRSGTWGEIGSPTSRMQIIENLIGMGLVNQESNLDSMNELIELSEKGRAFLSYCHKSTFDPDLPFRLAIWCQNQEYDKMARYIRTIFGKQKRYLSKLNIN